MEETARTASSRWPAWLRDPMHQAVHALGITQITAWGTSYYCLGVLGGPIARDTGWSQGFVFLGYAVALVAMSLASAVIGRAIDRHGARAVMCTGTLIVSAGLLALSRVGSEVAYLLVWAVLGLGMRCCLYDAAFAALVQVTPSRGRTAISYLTLYGAYASSIFWVIAHYLNEAHGWRGTLALFALINLVICLPLNWLGLSRKEQAQPAGDKALAASSSPDGPVLEGRRRTIGIALFAMIMSINAFVFGVISLQLVPLLEAAGLATAVAVWVASLKGHGQFAGRLIEILFGRNLKAMTTARITLAVLPVSLLILLWASGSFIMLVAFTVLMGMSQGVVSIVRGAVPLALFGSKGFGEVLGLIATPILLVNALAPAAFAAAVDVVGWTSALWILLGCALTTVLAIEMMARWHARAQREAAAGRAAS